MRPLTMRKISEVLRQRHELKRSYRDIARSLNISATTVYDNLARAKAVGINWPLPEGMSEQELFDKLFLPSKNASKKRPLPDWIQSHIRMWEYFGAVSKVVVPDNLKSGVTKVHRYDPDINANYQHVGEHYGFAIVPARASDFAISTALSTSICRLLTALMRNRHQSA